ncbi:Argininosuccinate lyase [Variovorax sp. PBS-H4]|uniref:Bug family tripartite tricarboxylate transporter substrate binding protein n=1 Tax=Variovorax sp. PBS-H4 TaxID=434008 RepID=UPI0013169830|nr:tripartite tricarboxylate transporter substrate binding protein [Variovorax sp. PBS-H4]VTU25971.1 Argininosuccinate lyase [Variovorax sp. PBS-H4]
MTNPFKLAAKIASSCVLAWMAFNPAFALAQSSPYPNKPIRLVIPVPAGGPTDALGRRVAQSLSETLGQSVVVDNKPGASGTIGSAEVARAAPDGYTLLFSNSDVFINVTGVVKKMPYDPLRDFTPVSIVCRYGVAMMVRPGMPAPGGLPDLLKYIKDHPGKVTYGSWGPATYPHLIGEALGNRAGAALVHVPYRGAAPALQDLLGGNIDIAFLGTAVAAGYAQKGQVRLVAVTGERRDPVVPDTPTFSEQGMTDSLVRMSPWIGIAAPARTPDAIVKKLQQAVVTAMATPEVRRTLRDLSMEAVASTPAEFATQLNNDFPLMTKLIRDAGVVPE